jgi:hypothetical protein
VARAKNRPRVDQPADVTLEASLWSDPRFALVASVAKVDVFSARARVARVWSACTDRESTTLPEKHVDLFAELAGFGRAMVAAELADETPDGLYIRGTQGRIDWLKDVRSRAAAGGRKTAQNRRERQATGAALGTAAGVPHGAPPATPLLCPRDQDQDQVLGSEKIVPAAPGTFALEPTGAKKPRAKSKPGGDHAEFLARYFELYRARSNCKPTIGEVEGTIARDLLAAHGLSTCLAKLADAFAGTHWWVKADQPVTLRSIRANFDGLSALAAPSAPMSQSAARAQRLWESGHWVTTGGLAAIEAGLRADGVEIPWRDHPMRVRMDAENRDGTGQPIVAREVA